MKRGVYTYLLVGGLAMLFVALGVLQYRWLSEISTSSTEKERRRVAEQADRMAADFNRELQNAYFNFQADANVWRAGNWNEFNERYDYWRSKTQYPELVREMYFVPKAEGSVLKYETGSRTFVPINSPETDQLAALARAAEPVKNFDIPSLTMMLPIIEPPIKIAQIAERRPIDTGPLRTKLEMPDRYGYLAIQLDPATIDENLLPTLTAKYFPDNDYRLNVNYDVATENNSDAQAKLYDLSPNNMILFANKDIAPKPGTGEKGEQRSVVFNSHIESISARTLNAGEAPGGKMEIKVQREGLPRTSIFTATTSSDTANSPTLLVSHISGSIDSFVTSKLRRDLAIGFSILLLMAAAVAAIIISSMRTRAAAQRQIDFVSSVSHEFRTPLAVIKSAGENLADGVTREADQVNRYGELIKSEGNKLNAMVEQILEFAGANSGRQKLKLEPTPVADLVNSAIDECRPIAEDRGFTIETNVAEGLPEINIDRIAISQAIQNLITNSIKYSNGERWVRISASNGNSTVKIAVEDRGIGISKSDLKQIFEPFFRSKEVVDAQIHGNGLGLSLVKKTVDAHGGNIVVTSEFGKGSKFTITLKSEPPA